MLEEIMSTALVRSSLFLVVVFGIGFLILYRWLVAKEMEPVPVALSVFGLIETAIVIVQKNPIPLLGVVILVIFVLLIVLTGIIFGQQRVLTDLHIEKTLLNPDTLANGVQNNPETREEIRKWIEIGTEMVDVDFFPGAVLESVFGARARKRKKFVRLLPSSVFDKTKFSADTFVLPAPARKPIQLAYSVVSTVSLLTLILLVLVIV